MKILYLLTIAIILISLNSSEAQSIYITRFEIPTGNVKRDDIVQVNVGVRNATNEEKSFWVGLSFGHEYTDLDHWPEGWYDIKPIQTNILAPGDSQEVTFSVIISKTLRTGQYYAISRIWESFNKDLYIMEEYIDGTENYPNWIDNPELGKKSFYLPISDEVNANFNNIKDMLLYIVKTMNSEIVENRYYQGYKPLLFFQATKSFNIYNGVTISAGAGIYFDLADMLGITPEGKEDRTTFWITGDLGGLSYSYYLGTNKVPFQFGIVEKKFNFKERGLADKDVNDYSINAGQITLPFGIITGLNYTVDNGWAGPKFEFCGTNKVGVTFLKDHFILNSGEISTKYLLSILDYANPIKTILSTDEYITIISNLFDSNSNNNEVGYSDFTFDDGDWEISNGEIVTDLDMHVFEYNTGYWDNSVQRFKIAVPNNAVNLKFSTAGGTGTVNLLYKFNNGPLRENPDSWDKLVGHSGSTNTEILIEKPKQGEHYIAIATGMNTSDFDYKGVTFTASYDTSLPQLSVTKNNINLGNKHSGDNFIDTFTVKNIGIGMLNGTISNDADWIKSINPADFSLENNETQLVTIEGVFPSNADSFNSNINITSNGGNAVIKIYGNIEKDDIKLVQHFYDHGTMNITPSISTDGNYLIVGRPYDSTLGLKQSGSVDIYKRNTNEWQLKQTLLPKEPTEYLHFGYRVSLSGENIAIMESGDICLYHYYNKTWILYQKINEQDISEIAIHKNWLVIGGNGKIYIYKYIEKNWEKYSDKSFAFEGSYGGKINSISISDNYIALGTPFSEPMISNYYSGSVHLFKLKNNDWTEINKPSIDESLKHNFGYSVSIFNNQLIVGPNSYLYKLVNDSCQFIKQITTDDAERVSFVGNFIVIGSSTVPQADINNIGKGSLEVFEYINEEWMKMGMFIVSDDNTIIHQDGKDILIVKEVYPDVAGNNIFCNRADGGLNIYKINKTINYPPSTPIITYPPNDTKYVLNNPNNNSIQISWICEDLDKDPLLYDIYLGQENDNIVKIASDIDSSHYTISNLVINENYKWFIVAKDGELSTQSSVSNFIYVPNSAPDRPQLITPQSGDKIEQNLITLKWKCTDINKQKLFYNVYLGTNNSDLVRIAENLDTTEYSIGLKSNTEYTWQVMASDEYLNTNSEIGKFNTQYESDLHEQRLLGNNVNFGYSVALNDSFCIIGEPGFNDKISLVHILKKVNDYWYNFQTLSMIGWTNMDAFGYSVAINDKYMLIGNPTDSADYKGKVYLYKLENGYWIIKQEIEDVKYKAFGVSLKIYDKYAFITSCDIVNIYNITNDKLNYSQTLIPDSNSINQEIYSTSIDVATNEVIFGSYNRNAAYIYNYDGSKWIFSKKLTPDNTDENTDFGYSVSIYDNYAIVGSRKYANIFINNNNNWVKSEKIIGTGDNTVDIYTIVSLWKNYLAVKVDLDQNYYSAKGGVNLYKLENNEWVKHMTISPSDNQQNEYFGNSIQITNTNLVIGLPRLQSGIVSVISSAYLYTLDNLI